LLDRSGFELKLLTNCAQRFNAVRFYFASNQIVKDLRATPTILAEDRNCAGLEKRLERK
jgi:hypothetical protein